MNVKDRGWKNCCIIKRVHIITLGIILILEFVIVMLEPHVKLTCYATTVYDDLYNLSLSSHSALFLSLHYDNDCVDIAQLSKHRIFKHILSQQL